MTMTESLKQQFNRIYEIAAEEALYKLPVAYIDENNNVTMGEKNMINTDITFKNENTWSTATAEDITRAIKACYGVPVYRGEAKFKKPEEKSEETPVEEKWVWVTGYKGLDKDMKAHGDFQYEMDKLYIMPDGERVEACHGGFHLCMKLEDLYRYKSVGSGNRFFECSALVRESDLEKYGKYDPDKYYNFVFDDRKVDKLAAKSIRLVRELSADEILAHVDGTAEWPQDIKEMAVAKDLGSARDEMKIRDLVKMGYARPLAEYMYKYDKDSYNLAVALHSQPGISMDTKVNAIFSHI